MEAKLVSALPTDEGWQFEPKWDGFRCLAFRAGSSVELQSKSGKSLVRYFPEVVTAVRSLPVDRFVLDGELAISDGRSLSFEALQNRLHPAESRVRKLAAETPAMFIVFDCLASSGDGGLMNKSLRQRRAALERFFATIGEHPALRLTPFTRDVAIARSWLRKARGSLDGVIAKHLDAPYVAGARDMLKVKLIRTADCVVGGFRYETDSTLVGSLLLGLYDEAGLLHHVGFTSGIKDVAREPLTRRLEKLIASPGFTGGTPGGPSRWSNERSAEWQPLKTRLVVEVSYDHVTGKRFRHGTRLLRWRADKKPTQCGFDQLQSEATSAMLIAGVIQR
jgi:ATP-dependent DNA ligase